MRTTQLGSNGPEITRDRLRGVGGRRRHVGRERVRGRGDRRDARRARRGHELDRHGRGLRQGRLRGLRRARGRRAPGRGPRRHEGRARVRGLRVPARAGPRRRARHRSAAWASTCIDLYQLHWPDATGVPVEETWGAMAELQDAGTVRFVGVSNFDRELIERCEAIRHVDSLQQEFSMLALDDRELIRWCGEHGTGVVSYGPLGFGLLTGAISRERAVSATDWRRSDEDGRSPTRSSIATSRSSRGCGPIAERLGITLAQLALAWNVAQPGVTSAIAGSRDPATRAKRGGRRRRAGRTDAGRDRGRPDRLGVERARDVAHAPDQRVQDLEGQLRLRLDQLEEGAPEQPDRLATGVSATTDALRGAPSSSATSPKKSPGRTVPEASLAPHDLRLPRRGPRTSSRRGALPRRWSARGERQHIGLVGQPVQVALRQAGEHRDDGERLRGLAPRAAGPLLGLAVAAIARRPAPRPSSPGGSGSSREAYPPRRARRERSSAVTSRRGDVTVGHASATAARVKCVDRIDDLAALLERTHRHPRRRLGRAPAGPRPIGGGLPRRAVPRPSDATSRATPTC